MIFLPIPQGPGLQDFLRTLLTAPPRAQATGAFLSSDPVSSAIAALVEAHSVSLPAFHLQAQAVRNRPQRNVRGSNNSVNNTLI